VPFDKELRWVLQHIILAHHGQYAFGSPKLPAIPEAIAVHYIDNLDAKLSMFFSEIENDRDPASRWTNYNRALETKVFKPDVMGVRRGNEATRQEGNKGNEETRSPNVQTSKSPIIQASLPGAPEQLFDKANKSL